MALKPKHIPHAFRQDPDALPRKPNLQKLCLMPKAFFVSFLVFCLREQSRRRRRRASMERSRPKGTDGSDYAYRMTIDNRYKRAAEGRARFRKFISAQALLQLLKATWACLAALDSEQPSMSLVASCGFGGAAVVVGTFAMKGSASKLLRAYIFFTAIAIILSLVPLMSGQDTGKWKDSMEYFQVTGDYQRVVMASLKGLLELAGIVVQVISVLTSISLLRNVSPPKRAE